MKDPGARFDGSLFADNAYYGHERILRAYCRVSHERALCGIVQHGWTPGTGVVEPQYLQAPWRKYVWSSTNLRLAREAGAEPVDAIGAPFLYRLAMRPATPVRGRGVVAFPFHGTEGDPVDATYAQYAEILDALVADGFGPITVCMYWLEHADPILRKPFEDRGFSVTTLGHRDTTPDFIDRFVALVETAAFVTSNRIGTALFYGLAMGRAAFVHGPSMGLRSERNPDRVATFTAREFPKLAYVTFDGSVATEYADRELGREFVRSPQALAAELLWRPEDLAAWSVQRATIALERHARSSAGRWLRFSRRWLLG